MTASPSASSCGAWGFVVHHTILLDRVELLQVPRRARFLLAESRDTLRVTRSGSLRHGARGEWARSTSGGVAGGTWATATRSSTVMNSSGAAMLFGRGPKITVGTPRGRK